jgi:hypothetical protein
LGNFIIEIDMREEIRDPWKKCERMSREGLASVANETKNTFFCNIADPESFCLDQDHDL